MTIEELSEEYVKSTLIGSESIKKSAFKAGGNAVLKEIEKIVEMSKIFSDHSTFTMLYRNLEKTIAELKNE